MTDTHDTNLPEKAVELEEDKKTAEVPEPATTETSAEETITEKVEEPAPKLTKEEHVVVKAFSSADHNYYVARDESGVLCIYALPPVRREWNWDTYSSTLILNPNLFPFITWESGKAWSIEELKELKVKE